MWSIWCGIAYAMRKAALSLHLKPDSGLDKTVRLSEKKKYYTYVTK